MTAQTAPSKWDQFCQLIELHKFYYERIVTGAVYSSAIVGGVLSYVLNSDIRDRPRLLIALAVPFLLSLGTGILGFIGIFMTHGLSKSIKKLQSELSLSWRPHAELLPWMTGILASLFLIGAIAMFVCVVFCPEWLPTVIQKKTV